MVEQKRQPPPLPTPNASWYSRNWKWFIPAFCAAAFVFTAISFVCVFTVVSLGMKSLGAYKIAVKRAESDPRVTAATGTPLKEGWFIGGSFNVNGPRAKGTIYLVATESKELRTPHFLMSFSKLIFQVDNSGERINLQDKNR